MLHFIDTKDLVNFIKLNLKKYNITTFNNLYILYINFIINITYTIIYIKNIFI